MNRQICRVGAEYFSKRNNQAEPTLRCCIAEHDYTGLYTMVKIFWVVGQIR